MNQSDKERYFVQKGLPVIQQLKTQFESDGLSGGEQTEFFAGLAVVAGMSIGVDEQWMHDQLTESWRLIAEHPVIGPMIRAHAIDVAK